MINPQQITKFDRSVAELQEFLLFCVTVHGKKAAVQAVKLEQLLIYLSSITGHEMPFDAVKIAMETEDEVEENLLVKALKKVGMGQYGRITQSFDDLVKLPDLRSVTVEQLEACYAVGPKTARFFVVHSRPEQNHAILDTHILKWMSAQGIADVPKNTPQGKWYHFFEKIFLTKVKESGKTVAEFDLSIWKSFATV